MKRSKPKDAEIRPHSGHRSWRNTELAHLPDGEELVQPLAEHIAYSFACAKDGDLEGVPWAWRDIAYLLRRGLAPQAILERVADTLDAIADAAPEDGNAARAEEKAARSAIVRALMLSRPPGRVTLAEARAIRTSRAIKVEELVRGGMSVTEACAKLAQERGDEMGDKHLGTDVFYSAYRQHREWIDELHSWVMPWDEGAPDPDDVPKRPE